MTTLILFDSDRSEDAGDTTPRLDWGTGKPHVGINSGPVDPQGSASFLYTGEPVSQTYRNTDLTLSNVRINDELIPAPCHTTNISPHQIPLIFPSNHPFSSHISEKAIFPTACSTEDIRPSTYSDPFIVTHKIRGNPFRREVHYHGLQLRQHQSFKWPDKHYMQLPRSLSDVSMSAIYPSPRKMFVPNDDANNRSSIPTANVVKNKDRILLETTYQGDYSNGGGLGSHVLYDTAPGLSPTEKLKPYFEKTLDPARPIEGVQALQIHGNQRPPSALKRQPHFMTVPATTHVMSEDEKLDDHMRHGTDYVNLPAHLFPTEKAPIWTPRQETIDDSAPTGTEIRFLKRSQPATTFTQLSRHRYANFQQMDAENRLQSLEMIRPSDNKNLLNVKLRTLQHPRHPRPILPQYRDDYVNTFYDQMGSYVQERSGLYHTANYDPNTLAQAIPELENRQTATDNKQEEDEQPTYAGDDHLNDLLAKAEQIQGRSKPQSFQYRALGDYNGMRARLLDKLSVPRDSGTVDARTQEGNTQFVQRDSIYGQAYNTPKFLQENVLSRQARFDPTRLMSTTYNRDLDRVRNGNSSPMIAKTSRQIDDEQNPTKEDRSGDILVGPLLHPPPYDELYSTKYINEHTNGYSRRTSARVYDSPFKAEHDNTAYQLYQQRPPSPKATSFDPFLSIPAQIPRSAKTAIRLPGPEIVARFVEPNLEPHTTYQHSFKDIAYHEKMPLSQDSFISPERAISGYRLSMKDNDWRFGRMTDGRVKQWKLIDLQDRWTKTQAQRQYHIAHPEAVPYVGDSTIRAKKEILIADTLAKRGMMTVR